MVVVGFYRAGMTIIIFYIIIYIENFLNDLFIRYPHQDAINRYDKDHPTIFEFYCVKEQQMKKQSTTPEFLFLW